MEKTHHRYLKSWDERVNDKRRKYFFEKIFPDTSESPYSLKRFGNDLISDVRFVLRKIYAVAKQLKVFGPVIRKEYGVPLYIQLYRLLYLTLIVRKSALEFRKHLLFKPESWKNVNLYDYGQTHTQSLLASLSFPEEVQVIEDKFAFYTYCKSHHIQTPEIAAVYSIGKQIYPENKRFDVPREDLFIKERKGGKGSGARNFTFLNGAYIDSSQKKYSTEELLEFISGLSQKADLIVQKRLTNHHAIKPFSSGALSTCRIVTVKSLNNNAIRPLFAFMRMPCGGKDVDNYAQGGLLSTIDIETGTLGRAVTYIPYNGKFEFDEHPDTRQNIKGVSVPGWKEMLDFTIASHKKFKTLAVGWDVCYSEDGIYLVEGNITWGSTAAYESPEQKPFRDTNYPVIYEELMLKISSHE